MAAGVATALWLMAALLLFGRAGAQGLALDAPGALRLLPTPAVVDVGSTVTVELWLEDGGNYYGLDVQLAFDPQAVQVLTQRVTPLWEVFDAGNHFTLKNEANNIAGMVWYAVVNLNPAQPFTGTGRVCAIAFTGVASATVPLRFTYAKGSTRRGDSLFPALSDGSILVRTPQRHALYVPLVVRNVPAW